jgi:hypothetical protein
MSLWKETAEEENKKPKQYDEFDAAFDYAYTLEKENELKKMEENSNTELFSATMVLTAYVDENGNVKYVKSSWDDLFKKEEE